MGYCEICCKMIHLRPQDYSDGHFCCVFCHEDCVVIVEDEKEEDSENVIRCYL